MKYKQLLIWALISIICLGAISPAYANTNNSLVNFEQELEEYRKEDVVWAEKMLSTIVKGFGRGLQFILSMFGISIDSVIFSDNSGLPTGIENKLSFSFGEDNFFGKIANALYAVFRGISLIYMLPILALLGIRVWFDRNTQSNLAWKESMSTFVISMLLLFMMPTIAEFVYNLVINIARGLRTVGGVSFIEELYKGAESNRLIDSILYAGGVGLTAWFAFVYAYLIMSFIIVFSYFPAVVTTRHFESFKTGFEGWVKLFISLLFTPVVDSSLLLIVTMAVQNGAGGLIGLILGSAIIPSRGLIRQLLGLSNGGLSEMMGFAALSGVTGLVKSGSQGLKKGISDFNEGRGDIREANKYGKGAENLNREMGTDSQGAGGLVAYQGVSSSYSPSTNVNTEELLSGPPTSEYAQTRRELTIPLKQPKAGEDIYSYNLKRQGMRKMAKASFGMATAGAGALGLGSLGSLQGMGAMTYGAQIGGHIGDLAGTAAGIGYSNLQDRQYDNRHEEKGNADAENTKAERIEPIRVNNGTDFSYSGEPTHLSQQEASTQFYGLPKSGGINEKGEFTFENIHQDINSNLNQSAKDDLKKQAYNTAIDQTGIDPQVIQRQYQEEVNRLYNGELQQRSNRGESITVDVKTEALNNAQGQAQVNVRYNDNMKHFSRVANLNYEGLQLNTAYNDLQKSGYSPSILTQYNDSIRDHLKATLEAQVYEMNVEEDMSVDDII